MRSQAAQQAGRLARATLAEAGSCGLCSTAAGAQGGHKAFWLAVNGAAGAGPGCRSPAAAAAATGQWQRGLWSWASAMPQACPAAPQQQQRQQNWHQQQQRSASAQAEPSSSSSSSSSSSEAQGLSLSDGAVQRLKELQAQSSEPLVLRVTVEGGGCSGFQYEFAMEEGDAAQLSETDRLFERDGVRVVCDDISLSFLGGATVDFESDLMRSAFVIASNPNAASSCGCGSSFVAK